jgi:hypothetical protein
MNEKYEGSQSRNDEPPLPAFETLLFELLERGNQAGYEAYSAGHLTAEDLNEIYKHLAGISSHGERLLQALE